MRCCCRWWPAGSAAPTMSSTPATWRCGRWIGFGVRGGSTAYRAALELLATRRYPFANLPRRCAGSGDTEDLLAIMAGEHDGIPPVHGVFTP